MKMRNFFFGRLLLPSIFGLMSVAASAANVQVCSQAIQGLFHSSPQVRILESIQDFRVGTLNTLFLELEGNAQKPVAKIQGLADAILESKLDVVVLEEVKDEASLKEFNSDFLKGQFEPIFQPGNDPSSHVVFLVKKDLPFDVTYLSHKAIQKVDPTNGNITTILSRDLPALVVRAKNPRPGTRDPLFVFIGTHFKSKRPRPGDFESRALRKAQVDTAVDVIADIKKKFGPNVPVMLGGDFNGSLHKEAEFASLWSSGAVEDPFKIVESKTGKTFTAEERTTHTFFPQTGGRDANQIDAVLVSPSMKDSVKDVKVYRYKDASGKELPLPATYAEREKNPSDHYPLILTLDFQKLIK